jgi:TolB-like protein/DNA-binding winged helix-turn-helix (wHTH) protein
MREFCAPPAMPESTLKQRLRFGDFEFDPSVYELRHNGTPVRLERQPMDLLILLVERRNQLVSREDIVQRLWDPRVFVDVETGVNTAVRKLRIALGDSAENPRFIETVPRRGYRFVAEVVEESSDAPVRTPATQSPENGGRSAETNFHERAEAIPAITAQPSRLLNWRRTLLFLAGAVVLLIAVRTAYLAFRARPTQPGRSRIMLAILPFQNLSNRPDQEYLSDGLTEETITDLGELSPDGMGVIARTSAMAYKHTNKTVGQIGSELGVDYVLEGSVRRQDDRVRISAQLIRVKDQTHVWAHSYDRELKDVLEAQNELGKAIAGQVQANLNSEQEVELSRKRTVDPEAYDLYLKGRYYWNQRTPDSIQASIRYFQQAAAKDPNFALAYAGLAQAYNISNIVGPYTAAESLPKVKEAAMKAIELDPYLAEAHAALGMEKSHYDFDFPGAREEFLKAIRINPNSAYAHFFYSNCYLMPMGLDKEAIEENQKALELDPLSLPINNFMAMTYLYVGDYEKSYQQFQRTIEMNPNWPLAHDYFAGLLFITGRYREAIQEDEKTDVLRGARPDVAAGETFGKLRALDHGGEKGYWQYILAGVSTEMNEGKSVDASTLATLYALAGDKDKAFEWLDKAYAEHDGQNITLLKVDPLYRNLHGDPRFGAMLRRLGLPE